METTGLLGDRVDDISVLLVVEEDCLAAEMLAIADFHGCRSSKAVVFGELSPRFRRLLRFDEPSLIR